MSRIRRWVHFNRGTAGFGLFAVLFVALVLVVALG